MVSGEDHFDFDTIQLSCLQHFVRPYGVNRHCIASFFVKDPERKLNNHENNFFTTLISPQIPQDEDIILKAPFASHIALILHPKNDILKYPSHLPDVPKLKFWNPRK